MAAQKLTDQRFHLIAKALADPRRFDLLRRIGNAGDTLSCESLRTCCCDVTPATISHHMKELETAGLVESTREGKFVTYRLRREVLEGYLARMAQILENSE
ncbi:MAG: metalloregulator ArsR/SmtB family transcription factor [Acidobacteriota bacterium]|nr:metalloregulator ArsR/SmtB family transcription factor [Acidobacteriota bacterium]